MSNDNLPLIIKLVKLQPITTRDITDELYNICDREHASCNYECPVFRLNGSKVPAGNSKSGCICFKDGMAMLNFIRGR